MCLMVSHLSFLKIVAGWRLMTLSQIQLWLEIVPGQLLDLKY